MQPISRINQSRPYSSVVALLVCGGSVRARTVQPAQSVPAKQGTISVVAQLVVLPVRVTGADGDFISGLTQEQFQVYEDGRRQPITIFRQEDTPVTVGLIVDHSRSMGPKLAGVAAAVSAFAESSNPDDEMFVVDFSDRVSDGSAWRKAFHQQSSGTGAGGLGGFGARDDRALRCCCRGTETFATRPFRTRRR